MRDWLMRINNLFVRISNHRRLSLYRRTMFVMPLDRRLTHRIVTCLIAAASIAFAGRAPGSNPLPADLDPTFANGGIAKDPFGFGGGYGPDTISLLLRRDGKVLWGPRKLAIVLLDATGNLDRSYKGPEGRDAMFNRCIALNAACDWEALAILPSDDLLVGVTARTPDRIARFGVSRFTPEGLLDTALGSSGIGLARPLAGEGQASAVAVLPDGMLLVGGSTSSVVRDEATFAFARFDSRGAADESFGDGGIVATSIVGRVQWLLARADGSTVVVGVVDASANRPSDVPKVVIVRLMPNGLLDPSFGDNGRVLYDVGGSTWPSKAVLQPDQRILVAVRHGLEGSPGGVRQFTLLRFLPDGKLDPAFGAGGRSVFTAGEDDSESQLEDIALQPDGRIVATGTVIQHRGPTGFRRIALARFREDGSPDPTFAAGGVTLAWSEAGADAFALATDGNQRIRVGGNIEGAPELVYVIDITPAWIWRQVYTPAVFAFAGGDAAPRIERQAVAVEYYHSRFAHYFVTATSYEIALLDTDPAYMSAWARTGQQFQVYKDAVAGLAPMCRFFSGSTFAPKSSHFYTAYDWECALVKGDPAWSFEGNVFTVGLPDAQGNCGQRSPMYRFYNNGLGGAPNHRYTTSDATRMEMVARGWSPEGAGVGVTGCLPAQ